MIRKKVERWIGSSEAAEILTRNSGHPVSDAYVRLLGKNGKIAMRAKNRRENEYREQDVENYQVRAIKKKQDTTITS